MVDLDPCALFCVGPAHHDRLLFSFSLCLACAVALTLSLMSSIHTSSDARTLARKRLPWMVFDYIDGAAGGGYGEQLNRDIMQAIRIQPRVLTMLSIAVSRLRCLANKRRYPLASAPWACVICRILAQMNGWPSLLQPKKSQFVYRLLRLPRWRI